MREVADDRVFAGNVLLRAWRNDSGEFRVIFELGDMTSNELDDSVDRPSPPLLVSSSFEESPSLRPSIR